MAAKTIVLKAKRGRITSPTEFKGRELDRIVQLFRDDGYWAYYICNDPGTHIKEYHMRKDD